MKDLPSRPGPSCGITNFIRDYCDKKPPHNFPIHINKLESILFWRMRRNPCTDQIGCSNTAFVRRYSRFAFYFASRHDYWKQCWYGSEFKNRLPCSHASENPHALIKMKPTHTVTPVMKIVNVR
jgi:hypothetical protein